MKTVYFVRHGQSVDNVIPVFQSPDSPLSEKGREQARIVAGRVAELSFDALIASPFQRAKETAMAIEKITGKKGELSNLFIERVKPTSINGKSFDDAKAGLTWKNWEESLYVSGVRIEDGENFDDLMARADKSLAFLASRTEESIVVVTHGFFLRVLVARVLLGDLLSGETLRRVQSAASTENTGITVLQYRRNNDAQVDLLFEGKPEWRLWIYNDHAQLG